MTAEAKAPALVEAAEALRSALDSLGVRFMFIGGLAVLAAGIGRTTADVDAAMEGGADLDTVLRALSARGIEPRIPDAAAFARQSQVLLLRHTESGVPLDVSMAWLPFELEALRRRREMVFEGRSLPFPTPEDLLIYKLVAARPRDLDDAQKLLVLHNDAIRRERVRETLRAFAEALESPERMSVVDKLLSEGEDPVR